MRHFFNVSVLLLVAGCLQARRPAPHGSELAAVIVNTSMIVGLDPRDDFERIEVLSRLAGATKWELNASFRKAEVLADSMTLRFAPGVYQFDVRMIRADGTSLASASATDAVCAYPERRLEAGVSAKVNIKLCRTPLADAAVGTGGSRPLQHAFCALDPASYPANPRANSRLLQKVLSGYKFLEGPVWDAASQTLFFSDMDIHDGGASGPKASIHRYTPHISSSGVVTGDAAMFVDSSGTNGLAVAPNGDLIAATHATPSLSKFDINTKARQVVHGTSGYKGASFNSPNDLAVRSDGTIYFTDPKWQRGNRAGQGVERVYRVATDGSVTEVGKTRSDPNGIALSPDERTLYIGAADNKIYKHDVSVDGSVSEGRLFVSLDKPDGLAVDCAGNLYVAAPGGVYVYRPSGEAIDVIRMDGPAPSNVAFGGEDRQTLFITVWADLYAMGMSIPGLPY